MRIHLPAGALGIAVVVFLLARPAAGEPASPEPEPAVATSVADPGPEVESGINAVFGPLVRQASRIMFWDPFAALGLYDPTLRDGSGRPLLDADGTPRTTRFPLVVLWLIAAALFFTLRLRFINFRGIFHAIDLIRGRYNQDDSPGQVTHFQALATALSGTVGLGNIAGVALAISLGGPGATFWMILAGLLGMATKFAECTLAVKYRDIGEQGEVSGGPMYYLRKGLAHRTAWGRSLAPLGLALGWTWAFFGTFGALGGGNMFQANQSFAIMAATFPGLQGQGILFGIVLALCVGAVIVGGIQGIGRVTGKVVPMMAVLYVSASSIIIFANIDRLPSVVVTIIAGAFAPGSIKGGIIGVMVIGLRRAAFSNEAGVGTAAIAHSAAKTKEPIAEGYVALHEPFIDTVLICTMTALVLIFTGYAESGEALQGAALTSAAFSSVISWFPYVLTVAILLFCYSTLISFAYYGTKCFDFCFGGLFERFLGRRKLATQVYTVVFLCATVVGSASTIQTVMNFSDMIIFGLILTNTIGLFLLSSEVAADLRSYRSRLVAGQLEAAAVDASTSIGEPEGALD